jgi:hypothetical protein
VQGRQKGAKRSRFPRERRRQGGNVALEPRNDTPGPRELRAWNADNHRRWNRQRKSGRQDRKPALLLPVKIDRYRASSDPDRKHVAESPNGVVPAISHLHRTQTGKVRSLFFEKPGYQCLVDVDLRPPPFGHGRIFPCGSDKARRTSNRFEQSLASSMSDYLIRQIEASPGHLEHLLLRDCVSGDAERVPAAAIFVLIGAQPFTGWLPDAIRCDQWGFIVTGPDAGQHWSLDRPPFLLETTTPGVFAVGDVRHGSMKRVASAVGDGSTAVRLIHDYLALAPPVSEGHETRLQARNGVRHRMQALDLDAITSGQVTMLS